MQVKTDLLHVYTNDVEDASPLELRSFNVELLQKKINDLEEENKNLHSEASQVTRKQINVLINPDCFVAVGPRGGEVRGEGGEAREGRGAAPHPGQHSD